MSNKIVNQILGNGDFNYDEQMMQHIRNNVTKEEVVSKLYHLFHMKVNRIKRIFHLSDEEFYDIFKPK